MFIHVKELEEDGEYQTSTGSGCLRAEKVAYVLVLEDGTSLHIAMRGGRFFRARADDMRVSQLQPRSPNAVLSYHEPQYASRSKFLEVAAHQGRDSKRRVFLNADAVVALRSLSAPDKGGQSAIEVYFEGPLMSLSVCCNKDELQKAIDQLVG